MSLPVSPESLAAALALILQGAGTSSGIAAEVAAALVDNDLAGHRTHGARQLDFYVDRLKRGKVDGQARSRLVSDGGTVLRLDGKRAFGQVAGAEAARLGIARAKETGICMVALAGAGHLGRNGLWAEMAADQGIGSLHFGQGLAHVGSIAPHGGREGRLHTNPIAFGLPGSGADDALIFDAATSAVSASTVKQMADQGRRLDEPVLVRSDGTLSDNPSEFVDGLAAMLPFGGFKGYAISVFSEVLSLVLSAEGKSEPETNSLLSIYFDVSRLAAPGVYGPALAAWRARLLSCPPAGTQPVMLPGDRSRLARGKPLMMLEDVARRVQAAALMVDLWPEAKAACPPLAIAEAGV